MTAWHLGNLSKGDIVYVVDITGQESPQKTKVRSIDSGWDDEDVVFHCRQIVIGGCEIWSFDYNGNTINSRYKVVTARE